MILAPCSFKIQIRVVRGTKRTKNVSTRVAFTDVATVGVDEAQLVALRSQALGANRPRVLLDDLDALGPVPDPVTPGAEQPVLLRFSEPVALVALVR